MKNFQIKVKDSGYIYDVQVNEFDCVLTNSEGFKTTHSRVELASQLNTGRWIRKEQKWSVSRNVVDELKGKNDVRIGKWGVEVLDLSDDDILPVKCVETGFEFNVDICDLRTMLSL